MLVTQQEVQKASGILIIMFMFLSLMQRYQSHVLSSAVPGIEKQLVLILTLLAPTPTSPYNMAHIKHSKVTRL